MENIYIVDSCVSRENLSHLSSSGAEVEVYCDSNYVYKFFKKNYQLRHQSEEEIDYLTNIPTKRILMPTSKLIHNGNFVGYMMKYIQQKKDIMQDSMGNLLKELIIMQDDIESLSKHKVRLIDVNESNAIYNGELYLIDSGNYYINNIQDLLYFFENNNISDEEKENIIRKWNYEKINKLIYQMIFMNNPNIDFYILRKIIEFFKEERQKDRVLYDVSIYQKYFDEKLSVNAAINKFVKEYIKIDEKEKKLILSLLKK